MRTQRRALFSWLPGWSVSLSARLAWTWLLFVLVLAIIGPLIANEKPYYCRLDGESYFPIFSGIDEAALSRKHTTHSPVDWKQTAFESVWRAPIPYSYYTIDLKTGSHISPFAEQEHALRFRHWLGTDVAGRDVLAGMIRGCRVSLLIGLGSMLLALLIGIPVGSAAAYWGNNSFRISWMQMFMLVISILIFFYVFSLHVSVATKFLVWTILLPITLLFWFLLNRLHIGKTSFPLDRITMSVISVLDSFPGLFLILIVLVIIPQKGWLVVLGVIALMRWPVMARYMRAEVFKLKETHYIKSAQVINLPDLHILTKDIIPYAFRPVMISFIFGVSSAILAESSLSFLGVGLPVEELNWGRLLSQSRNHFDAWWLVLFPGFAIFFTLLSLYTIGNATGKSMVQRA